MCSPLGFEHLCQYTQTLSIYADAADDKNGADADVNDICNNRVHQRAHNTCVREKGWNRMEKYIFSFNKLLL